MEILLTHPLTVGDNSGEAPSSSRQKENSVLLKTGRRLCLGWKMEPWSEKLIGITQQENLFN